MTNGFLLLLFVTLAAFALSAGLTWLARRALLKRRVMDVPNARSMHTDPVPRGAGVAVVTVALGGMVLFSALAGSWMPQAWLFLAVLLLAGISWLDDRGKAGVGLRLSVHLLAAFLGSLALPQEAFLSGGLLPFWAERFLLIVGWAWFINLYNFMDGIDGITGVETVCVALGVLLITAAFSFGSPFAAVLAALLLGACGGFLVFNWHPAKIFLGDVGSVPLGFLTGYILLLLASDGFLAAALILPLYYLADSGLTFGRRLLGGEKVWQAHRRHFYQRAAQGVGRHDLVVRWILAANLALIAAALLATRAPLAGLALATAVVALLLNKMHKSSPT